MSCKYLTLILARDVRRYFWINTFFMASFVALLILGKSYEYIAIASVMLIAALVALNYIMLNRFFIRKTESMIKEFQNKMSNAASIDELTQVYNRRAGMLRLHEEFAAARRRDENLTVAMIDIDNFKKLNDTYGHQGGDEVLSHVANEIKSNLRENDVVFRYGGEEFLAILPNAKESEASLPLERLRGIIGSQVVNYNNQDIKTSISIGIASILDKETDITKTIARADKALYRAKATGRNKLVSTTDKRLMSLKPSLAA